MAPFAQIPTPTTPTSATLFNNGALGAITSTGDIVVGFRTTIRVSAGVLMTVRFGNATRVANATAADHPIFANTYQDFNTGEEFDRIRIFNTTAGAGAYWVYELTGT